MTDLNVGTRVARFVVSALSFLLAVGLCLFVFMRGGNWAGWARIVSSCWVGVMLLYTTVFLLGGVNIMARNRWPWMNMN